MRRAMQVTAATDPRTLALEDLWAWAVLPGWLGDDAAEHRRRFEMMALRYRSSGLPRLTATAAFFSAERARRDGAWQRAEALLCESSDVSQALQDRDPLTEIRLANLIAYQGQAERAAALIASADRDFEHEVSLAWNRYWVDQTRGALALTLGRPDEAIPPLKRVHEAAFVGRGCRDSVTVAGVDLVEALVAVGDQTAAGAAAERVAERLNGIVDPHGLALVERCRALTRRTGPTSTSRRRWPGTQRRTTRSNGRAPSCSSGSTCAAPGAREPPGSRCTTPAPRSTGSAPGPGPSGPAASWRPAESPEWCGRWPPRPS